MKWLSTIQWASLKLQTAVCPIIHPWSALILWEKRHKCGSKNAAQDCSVEFNRKYSTWGWIKSMNLAKSRPNRCLWHDFSLTEAYMWSLLLSSTYTNGKPLGRDMIHHEYVVHGTNMSHGSKKKTCEKWPYYCKYIWSLSVQYLQ